MTSLHPVQHGVHRGFLAIQTLQQVDPRITLDRIPDSAVTMAEVFQQAGYATWAVTDNVNISREEGFDQGFDHFWNYNYKGAETVNAKVVERAEEIRSAEPYFLYLHYMDPHRPYNRRQPLYERQEDELLDSIAAYDSEIHYVDGKIRELFELLDWSRDTVMVVTSDHGEEFQDHDGWDHGRTLYAEVLDVPLFFFSTADSLAAGRISPRTSTMDILPTLREWIGLPPESLDQGVSLLPALRGKAEPPAERTFFGDLRCPPWFDNHVIRSVIQGDHKFILTVPRDLPFYPMAGRRCSIPVSPTHDS